jgi:hypothetical protein
MVDRYRWQFSMVQPSWCSYRCRGQVADASDVGIYCEAVQVDDGG